MNITLADARYALLGVINGNTPINVRTNDVLKGVLSYLDAQVPLNVENEDLKQRLARAEAFINETYRQASALVQELPRTAHLQFVGRAERVQQENQSLNCIAHISTGGCFCPACRVRNHG